MLGTGVATVGVFIVALAIPEAWDDSPGGLHGPAVLVGAYLFVRIVHLAVYSYAAGADRKLLRQVTISWYRLW
jgi:Bacterial low temperature requirement A protein (LtrA)